MLTIFLIENYPWVNCSLIPNLSLDKFAKFGEWAWVGRVYA